MERGKQEKPSKRSQLFRPLVKVSQDRSKIRAQIGGMTEQADIVDIDAEVTSRWKKVAALFGPLGAYDHKTILEYAADNSKNFVAKCATASDFFVLLVAKLSQAFLSTLSPKAFLNRTDIDDRTVKEDLLKVYAILFQNVSFQLFSSLFPSSVTGRPEEKQRREDFIKQREMLNQFLLIMLHNRKNRLLAFQCDAALLSIIQKVVLQTQEKLVGLTSVLDLPVLVTNLYFHYEALAMLAASNESKQFMKDSANDGITSIYQTLERSLISSVSSALWKEIASTLVPHTESWQAHTKYPALYLCGQFSKKKFQLIHTASKLSLSPPEEVIEAGKIGFTLGYVNAYFAYKTAQALMAKNVFNFQDRTMTTLVAILKWKAAQLQDLNLALQQGSSVNKTYVEALLNENYICLKFMLLGHSATK